MEISSPLICLISVCDGCFTAHRRFTRPPLSVKSVDEASHGIFPYTLGNHVPPVSLEIRLRSTLPASPAISTLGGCHVYRPPPIGSVDTIPLSVGRGSDFVDGR